MSLKIHNEKAESIFRLIGKNENALTFALGYAFSKNSEFLIEFLKTVGVLEKRQGVNYGKFFESKEILLQHYNDDKSGIKDILLESNPYRIVIEAKTDNSFPTETQLLKYLNNEINKDWENFSARFIIILTRRQLNENLYKKVIEKLSTANVRLIFSTWSEIFGLLRKYLFLKPTTTSDFVLNELAKFLFNDYSMEIIEKEVIYRKVLKDYYHRICNKDGNGYYFDGGRENFIYPSCQFFQPCYGPARTSKKTGEFIRRIKNYQRLSYTEIANNPDEEMREAFKIHLTHFAEYDNSETKMLHVFTLGKKIPVHPNKINFEGSEKGYVDLENVLTD